MFKSGDKVKCVINELSEDVLTVGKIYTIKDVIPAKVQSTYFSKINDHHVTIIDDDHDTHFLAVRFEEVKTESTSSFVTTLPVDSKDRKDYPVFAGCVRYFPAALAGVANTSKLGNDKHNPGEELHHARGKSMDHGDCIVRHLMDVEDLLAAMKRGDNVTKEQILTEVNQMAWRALAFSQEVHEQFGAPLAPGAKK